MCLTWYQYNGNVQHVKQVNHCMFWSIFEVISLLNYQKYQVHVGIYIFLGQGTKCAVVVYVMVIGHPYVMYVMPGISLERRQHSGRNNGRIICHIFIRNGWI